MRKFPTAVCVAVLIGAGQLGWAQGPATEKPAAQALSPAVQAAITDLSSEDFKTREGALKRLQVAMGEQMRALVRSDDPEVQSRLISLLQFNDGLTRWMIDIYKLPAEERTAQLNFGLQPDMIPVLALAFSADPDKRVEGVKALAKIDKPEATALLAKMLSDPDRLVYIAAMEAVWDKKPTNEIVDALWDRAVEAGMTAYRGGGVAAVVQNVKFRGKVIPGHNFIDNSYIRRQQDAGIACDVLVNLKAPQVAAKLKTFLGGYEKAMDGTNPNVSFWMYTGNSEPMRNVFRLIEAYKSKDVIGTLYRIATGPVRQRQQGQMNNEKYFMSNRTMALGTVLGLTGQNLEDYKVKRLANLGNMWTSPTEADEEAAVKKLKEWWAVNGEKAGEGKTATVKEAAASQPATQKAEEAPPANNNVIIHRMQVGGGGGVQVQLQIGPASVDK
jgi:hypothetical protein